MNGGGRFSQGESFRNDEDDSDEESGEDFVTQQPPRFLERPVYNQNQPQPFVPQNAFRMYSSRCSRLLCLCRMARHSRREFPCSARTGAPRRRRRRPIGEHPAKSFNGRHSAGAAPSANGAVAGSDPVPDETAS